MTEISKIKEKYAKPRYSVNPTAFVVALICAPLVVTALSFWTLIGLFALPFGIIPYLVFGGPTLIWAVGHILPSFGSYAALGFAGNLVMGAVLALFLAVMGRTDEFELVGFLAGFGLIFAPLYAGTFGSIYATFHPNIRILQSN